MAAARLYRVEGWYLYQKQFLLVLLQIFHYSFAHGTIN